MSEIFYQVIKPQFERARYKGRIGSLIAEGDDGVFLRFTYFSGVQKQRFFHDEVKKVDGPDSNGNANNPHG